MANSFVQSMVKSLLPLVINNLDAINSAVRLQLENVMLSDEEVCAAYFCVCNDEGIAYIMTCTLDKNDKIFAIKSKQKLTEFIQSLIKMI